MLGYWMMTDKSKISLHTELFGYQVIQVFGPEAF